MAKNAKTSTRSTLKSSTWNKTAPQEKERRMAQSIAGSLRVEGYAVTEQRVHAQLIRRKG